MWENIVITGASAIAMGALAVPATRNLMIGDIEEDWLANELEFADIEPDGKTITLKNGTYMRAIQFTGMAYDAKTLEQQQRLLDLRTLFLHKVAKAGCSTRWFAVKRQQNIGVEAKYPNAVLQEIGDAENEEFTSSYYVNWYLAIASRTMEPLIDATTLVNSMMGVYDPHILERPEDPNKGCPLTGFINYLVTGYLCSTLPTVSVNISGNIPGADFDATKPNGHIVTLTPTLKLQKIIAVHLWPNSVSGMLFAEILALDGDIEISQVCLPWDYDQAIIYYKRKINEQKNAYFGDPSTAAESEATLVLLADGETTVFHTQLQIIARANDSVTLEKLLAAIARILGNRQVSFNVMTTAAPRCWFSRMPTAPGPLAGKKGLVHPLTIRNQNIMALWAMHHSPVGLIESPYGEPPESNRPVRFFKTRTGQAYSFQFQARKSEEALGNYLVFAPSGSGKSTLILYLLAGLAKFEGVRSYIFDSKEGARAMVKSFGGIYQGYSDLALNPLDVGEDTQTNRQRIYTMLKAISASAKPNDTDDEILKHAIELAFKLDAPDRTLNAIFEYAFGKRTSLRQAFARFVTDEKGRAGLDAHIFNAPHDSLGSLLKSSHMVGINMNEALDDPLLGPPVVTHISQAIFRSAAQSKKGFNVFIDESAKLLQNDSFKGLALEGFREIRKLNGSIGLAFQDPAALFRSGNAEAFLENTSTLIFFPNSNASRSSLEPFNLNDEQIGFILGGDLYARKEDRREVLVIKRDASTGFDESVILDIDLKILKKAKRHFRAGSNANAHIANLEAEHGENWRTYL